MSKTSNDGDYSSGSDDNFTLRYSSDSSFSSDSADNSYKPNDSCIENRTAAQLCTSPAESNISDSSGISIPSIESSENSLLSLEKESNVSKNSGNSKGEEVLSAPPQSDEIPNQINSIPSTSFPSVSINTELEYDFFPGKRRNSRLLFSYVESMFYKKNASGKTGTSYKCYEDNCFARVLVKSDGICIKKSGKHRHANHLELQKQIEAENKIKTLCLSDRSTKSTKELYDEVLINHQDLEKPYSKMQRNLRLLRSKGLPPSPLNTVDINIAFSRADIMDKFGYTLHERKREKFFQGTFSNDLFSFCVFASINTIKLIKESTRPENLTILMDGTFKVVPISCFSQLLIIYAQYNNKIYPMVYVLMSRKTQSCYLKVFEYIEENVCSIKCAHFITDYERAMKNALKKIHPGAVLTSCWFHFCQAVRKNMSQFEDLFELVRMNSRAAFIYRQFQCIPLLPEKLIKPTFEKLKSIAEEFNKNAFASFLSYYKDQWIVKEGPSSICVYQKETRTTGAVEAYNGVIGKKMKAHPPFFSFVESLQKEEFSKSTQMMQDLPLIDITKKRKERADRLNRINKATDELTNETITSLQFLEKVANLNNKVMKENHLEPKKPFELDNPDSNQSDSSDDNEESLCLICDQEKAEVLFFPCAHCFICAACWKKRSEETLSKGKTLKCPRIDCKKLVKRHTIISYECTKNQ